ncbi:uncharacterized protein LOC114518973 isoform X2 [Dendronephthya gigantea]|nr:uncharacterized protein LOC114518973 isoform X2 [Dendronephthya gigantea]
MVSGSWLFAINIQSNGSLAIDYKFDQNINNGSVDLGLVNTDKWFLLNITSQENSTQFQLSESNISLSIPCEPKTTKTKNIVLLGETFSKILKTGLQIGGETNTKSLKSFKGCVGMFLLNTHTIDLLNVTKESRSFKRNLKGTIKGCPCSQKPCKTGANVWDETKGKCVCKCGLDYYGEFCQNMSRPEITEKDDSENIYIIAGVAVGVLLLITLVICVVFYIKRTSSTMLGVYNPKNQEQVQGQQMNTAFSLPVPEKLI